MPIFISYSHADSAFVDKLASNLVLAKHNVWMDRWELNVGDSLTAKIEETLTASSAILVILSKASTASAWCRRELTAGLVRELEERHTLVLPCIIDDCEIPLFLRDKLYADFRKEPDKAFSLVDRSLARISNATMSRIESPDFYTDFSFDWKPIHTDDSEETWMVRWTFVDHGSTIPYVVLSELKMYAVESPKRYETAVKQKKAIPFIHDTLKHLVRYLDNSKEPLNGLIKDNFVSFVSWPLRLAPDEKYRFIFSYRRMGIDNGMDILIHLDNNIRMALKHVDQTQQGTRD